MEKNKIQEYALHVMNLYSNELTRAHYTTNMCPEDPYLQDNKNLRSYYKWVVCYVTGCDAFELDLAHQVDIEIQKIKREQTKAILSISSFWTKKETDRYFADLGGGDPETGKEYYEKIIHD